MSRRNFLFHMRHNRKLKVGFNSEVTVSLICVLGLRTVQDYRFHRNPLGIDPGSELLPAKQTAETAKGTQNFVYSEALHRPIA